jgi:hypothetical protein
MFRFVRSKEAGYNAVATGSKPKQCRYLNIIRHEDSIHFWNNLQEYLKAKIH